MITAAGNRKDPRLRPESAGVIIINGQMKELAGTKPGERLFRFQNQGKDIIAVFDNRLNRTRDFPSQGHPAIALRPS